MQLVLWLHNYKPDTACGILGLVRGHRAFDPEHSVGGFIIS